VNRGPFRLILTDGTEHQNGSIDSDGRSAAPVRLESDDAGVSLWWATGWADTDRDTVNTHSRFYPWHRVAEIRSDTGQKILA
jgi:hypothetical protein